MKNDFGWVPFALLIVMLVSFGFSSGNASNNDPLPPLPPKAEVTTDPVCPDGNCPLSVTNAPPVVFYGAGYGCTGNAGYRVVYSTTNYGMGYSTSYGSAGGVFSSGERVVFRSRPVFRLRRGLFFGRAGGCY